MIYIIEIDCICLFALFFVLGSMRKKSTIMSKYLYYAALCTMLAISMDILSLLIENEKLGILNHVIAFNYFINIIYYIAAVLATFLWFMNVEYTIDSVFWSKKRHILAALIPCFICAILAISSIFTGVYFYIDSNNIYHRGPHFIINNLVCYLYAFFCCGHALYASFKVGDYMKKKQYRLLACYIVFPVLLALIQTFRPDIPTIHVGMTVPIVYIYTELLDLQISTDYLTNLNNRNQLMQYLDMRIKNPTKEKALYLLLMDVDSFKKINDNYGHAEGDYALQKTADILRAVAKKFGGFVARYGGDEFTYVVEVDDPHEIDEIKAYIDRQSAAMSATLQYPLSLSVGSARYSTSLKIPELFLIADADMYKEKSIRKKLRGV